MPSETLTLAQAASLSSGGSFWTTKAVGDIPAIFVTDGPHGLRKQTGSADHLGIGSSVPATCFPPLAGLGQSWDPELIFRVGAALGDECQAENVHVLLGPGINIKRSPLGGRNFEYLSEDPHVSGALGAAWVSGLQSRGVGGSLKHYALNNQEHDRMRASSDVDPRPLREVYLRGFRRVVEDAKPWTVMCSYNRANGVQVSEDPFLLTQVLRDEWGYDGVVVSDWGAVRDRVAAVAAGLDLTMPFDGGGSDAALVAAVEAGVVDRAVVDRAASRVEALARTATAAAQIGATYDRDEHHALAREAAARSIVLLKNETGLLPLAPAGSIAVIGAFAETPRYQGGGSSHVTATRVDVPLEEIRAAAPDAEVGFAPGFTVDGSGAQSTLVAEAVDAAASADVAVVFLGLDARQESEGFDRENLDLPAEQRELLAAVAAAQPNTVVVLSHGGALDLREVAAHAAAILDGNLLGQAGGGAIADILFGAVCPSGKLTETVPLRIEDTPAYLDFPGEHQHVRYAEGLHVGYRWYDARDLDVAFPFGHGLSYTTFEYGAASARAQGDGIVVGIEVTNTGQRAGREVVQAYVSVPESAQVRVPRALAGFASVDLEPGERREVEIHIDRRDLEYWDIRLDRFVLESGRYVVTLGSSSRDLRASVEVELGGDEVSFPLTLESTMGEVLSNPTAAALIAQAMPMPDLPEGDAMGTDMARMMASIPIERTISFSGGSATREQLEQLLAAANAD
ncbi:glycoside hydrolase family 3 C-terminal domain-containing protein [Microbacterium sp. AK031]|uniref:glycoside hydrolase family 3 C-terminal domain-containing protein n=1 Tax=Microbacterium sp. AK031 TaxID=2723076 RepID=UPI002167C9E3|nr:glycoside hydrolase family 3 C-terminal domain-containing protein [Microbacterium sp. AK031]MCS3842374.1 beta-glucosidase [Microbacterium sp. AK031]